MSSVNTHSFRQNCLVCLLLIIATLIVYGQVIGHEFINLDDSPYVTENYSIQSGLNFESIRWAFTSTHVANWHPLTWLSHIFDYQLYGLNPTGHHLTNLFLHITNTILLFFVLYLMTGFRLRSAVVAALFALHPAHVESVAWVAERKDVLSTFFWMSTMLGYIWYVKNPSVKRYSAVIASFGFGLMAKPMLVTLPFVLLLVDYWPLKRKFCGRLVIEKIPLFLLAIASAIITFSVQKLSSVVWPVEVLSVKSRIANALVSYTGYIGKMIWPVNLAVYYPYPKVAIPIWHVAVSLLILVLITAAVFYKRKQYSYFLMGWLWYLGTLVPVIGLVQVGGQAMADRYTYIPFIGLFIAVIWVVPDIVSKWTDRKWVLGTLTALIILLLMYTCYNQLGHWKNNRLLFEHTLKVTKNNDLAHHQLGLSLVKEKQLDRAINHFKKAIEINPRNTDAYINLGSAYKDRGNIKKAVEYYDRALELAPENLTAKDNLGIVLAIQGDYDQAIRLFTEVLNVDPDNSLTHTNMGITLAMQGRLSEAIDHFSKALEIDPENDSVVIYLQKIKQALQAQKDNSPAPK